MKSNFPTTTIPFTSIVSSGRRQTNGKREAESGKRKTENGKQKNHMHNSTTGFERSQQV